MIGARPPVEVVRPGVLTTVQDEGRPGFASVAVSLSGAFDRPAYALANRIVGNRAGAPALEVVLGDLRLRFGSPAVVGAAGAPVKLVVTDSDGRSRTEPTGHAVPVDAGEVVAIEPADFGLRSYLALSGGIGGGTFGGVECKAVLGSWSTDTLSGLGPPPLAAGDRLGVGNWREGLPAPDQVPLRGLIESPVIDIVAGPRIDWLSDAGRIGMTAGTFVVGDRSDRIGVRLSGPDLERRRHDELASEALVVGAIQLPPGGEPIIFGPDHPATGGYPVVAVVVESHLPLLAQLRPGDSVRFRWRQP